VSACAWVNGSFVSGDEPCLGFRERGFLYGDGLFETVRVYQGKPFALKQHLARLREGCQVLKIPYPREEVEKGLQEVLGSGNLQEGTLRITVTRGEAGRGLLPSSDIKPTVVISADVGEPYPQEFYGRGFRAVTVSFPRSQFSPLVSLKSLNFLENVLGRLEAAARGADEGIFLNLRGEVAEGTISNLFLVFPGNLIITPPLESGILPGITREIVIRLARERGFVLEEKAVFPEDFRRAKEAFLTNSLLEVMPLVAVDGREIGSGKPGCVALFLRKAYQEYVFQEVAAGERSYLGEEISDGTGL